MSQITSFNSGGTPAVTRPAFFADLLTPAYNVTGAGAVYYLLCDRVDLDTTTSYDPLTGIYTVPQSGLYSFTVSLAWNALAAGYGSVIFEVNGTQNWNFFLPILPTGLFGGNFYQSYTSNIILSAGDTVRIRLVATGSAGNTVGFDGGGAIWENSSFSGFKAS